MAICNLFTGVFFRINSFVEFNENLMKKLSKYLAPSFLLVGSYVVLFLIWDFMINSILVPWDGTLPENRPEVGTLMRDMNDFFEKLNVSLPLILVLIGVLILFVRTRIYPKKVISSIEYAGITNMMYMVVAVLVDILMQLLSEDIGYNLSRMIVHVALVSMLFFMQAKNYKSGKLN